MGIHLADEARQDVGRRLVERGFLRVVAQAGADLADALLQQVAILGLERLAVRALKRVDALEAGVTGVLVVGQA